jgi:hypothetical protein
MQIFTKGLITPKHEWLLAVEILVQPPPPAKESTVVNVLNGIENPLQCRKKDIDFIVEDLIKKLKKDKINLREFHIVDLGPVGSALNLANRGLHRRTA